MEAQADGSVEPRPRDYAPTASLYPFFPTRAQIRTKCSQVFDQTPCLFQIEFAEAIIEKMWKWPSLEEVERVRRDRTEILTECECRDSMPKYTPAHFRVAFTVTPSQLFLILGKGE